MRCCTQFPVQYRPPGPKIFSPPRPDGSGAEKASGGASGQVDLRTPSLRAPPPPESRESGGPAKNGPTGPAEREHTVFFPPQLLFCMKPEALFFSPALSTLSTLHGCSIGRVLQASDLPDATYLNPDSSSSSADGAAATPSIFLSKRKAHARHAGSTS